MAFLIKKLELIKKESDYTKGRQMTAGEIASSFGVPHQLLNIEGSQKFANFKEARVAFYVDTILPQLSYILDFLNRSKLVKQFGKDIFLCYDEDKITALAPMRQQLWDNVSNSQILTLNEKRKALGFPPYEPSDNPADQVLVNTSLIPIEETSISETEPDPNDINPDDDGPDDDDSDN